MAIQTYLGNQLIKTFFDADNVAPFQNITSLSIDYILVAGGGGGGFYGDETFGKYRGGGGGAGGLLTGSAILSPSENIIITIGTGGTRAISYSADTSNGGNSTIQIDETTYYTIGGGGAGTGGSTPNINGKNGGSGGGGGSLFSTSDTFITNGTGGSSTQVSTYGYGLGQPGCNGGTEVTGGSGGSGVSTINTNCPTVAQNGLIWFDGLMYAYAGTGQVSAGQNLMTRGYGGNVNYNGGDGICVIRYAGGFVRGSGGTITYSNGYTYHTFTNNGTFAYN